LTLLRFLVAQSEASLLLEDLALSAEDGQLTLSKRFEKEATIELLREFLEPPQ
jgi:hypothetical protein